MADEIPRFEIQFDRVHYNAVIGWFCEVPDELKRWFLREIDREFTGRKMTDATLQEMTAFGKQRLYALVDAGQLEWDFLHNCWWFDVSMLTPSAGAV